MAPVSPAPNYVSDYLKLLPESDLIQFQKILEMKVCSVHMSRDTYQLWMFSASNTRA